MEATPPAQPPLVGLSLEAPREVRRASVAFRIILAIPHLLFAVLLEVVAMFAVFAAWWAALFTGRMPDGIGDFLAGIVRYFTRLRAYLYLLTDDYPPFSTGPDEYPVNVVLPPRGKLNRASVFFRMVLGVPSFFLLQLVTSGLIIPIVIIWLITLVSGRLPTSAFEAESAVLRYEARAWSWFLMLTSTYPGGLFGDPVPAWMPAPPPPPGPHSTLPPPPPPPSQMAAPPAPSPWPASAEPAPSGPRITVLRLSNGGRRLLVTIVVIGVLTLVGQIVATIALGGFSTEASRALHREHHELTLASREHLATAQTCALAGGPECLHAADRKLAVAMRRFQDELRIIDFPDDVSSDVDDLHDDAERAAGILDEMAVTNDPAAYQRLANEYGIVIARLNEDYDDLDDSLFFD